MILVAWFTTNRVTFYLKTYYSTRSRPKQWLQRGINKVTGNIILQHLINIDGHIITMRLICRFPQCQEASLNAINIPTKCIKQLPRKKQLQLHIPFTHVSLQSKPFRINVRLKNLSQNSPNFLTTVKTMFTLAPSKCSSGDLTLTIKYPFLDACCDHCCNSRAVETKKSNWQWHHHITKFHSCSRRRSLWWE